MKNLIGLICLISLTLFTSCSKEDVIKLGENFDLNFEQTLAFEEGGFEIKLIKVDDSRCPTRVLCVTAGAGVIELQITHPDHEDVIMRLAIADNSLINIPGSSAYQDYRIEFIDLLPYPESDAIELSQYTAVLNITKE